MFVSKWQVVDMAFPLSVFAAFREKESILDRQADFLDSDEVDTGIASRSSVAMIVFPAFRLRVASFFADSWTSPARVL